jgi:hypothetical protein
MAESLAVVAGPLIVSDVTDVAGRWKEGLQMSASTTIDSSLDAATSRRRRLRERALTAVRVLLPIQFGAGGLMKLAGAEPMVRLFDEIGAGQWLRFLVGVLELAGAVGLLIPALVGADWKHDFDLR